MLNYKVTLTVPDSKINALPALLEFINQRGLLLVGCYSEDAKASTSNVTPIVANLAKQEAAPQHAKAAEVHASDTKAEARRNHKYAMIRFNGRPYANMDKLASMLGYVSPGPLYRNQRLLSIDKKILKTEISHFVYYDIAQAAKVYTDAPKKIDLTSIPAILPEFGDEQTNDGTPKSGRGIANGFVIFDNKVYASRAAISHVTGCAKRYSRPGELSQAIKLALPKVPCVKPVKPTTGVPVAWYHYDTLASMVPSENWDGIKNLDLEQGERYSGDLYAANSYKDGPTAKAPSTGIKGLLFNSAAITPTMAVDFIKSNGGQVLTQNDCMVLTHPKLALPIYIGLKQLIVDGNPRARLLKLQNSLKQKKVAANASSR